MNGKENINKQGADTWKWALIALLLVIGIGGNYYFSAVMVAWRLIVWLLLFSLLALLASQTSEGRKIWAFAQQSRTELRKVVWPSREETTKMTMVVVVMVVVVALLLWLIDTGLLWVIGLLTGQRG